MGLLNLLYQSSKFSRSENRLRLLWWRRVFLCLIALSLSLVAGYAMARAGGGGGFSGGGGGFSGGGGGFSSGGGSSGDGAMFRWLIYEHPVIGIPIIIVVVAFFLVTSYRKGHSASVSRTIRRGNSLMRKDGVESVLSDIRARDPLFDVDTLCGRCGAMLPGVQYAWSQQDMTSVRHFISDGIFERFSLQIEMQKASGLRNEMRNVTVKSCRLIDAASDSFFDTVHLAVTASAVDELLALESGKKLQGSGREETFTEVWTFLRRPGTRTLKRPGLLEGYCPNCGTKLTLSTSVSCGSCKALINSGEYDWVLSEITQAEVWGGASHRYVSGVDVMQAQDAAFNLQSIEDRVSAIFWHVRAAEFFASSSYLNAVALPAFVASEQMNMMADERGRRLFYADAAVGSVDVVDVQVGDGISELMDRVSVRVLWSGHRENLKVPGLIVPQWGQSTPRSHVYVLARQHGVQSKQSEALTSLHCPGCGAAQVAESTGHCQYCGIAQNDGSTSWVLEGVTLFNGFARRQSPKDRSGEAVDLPNTPIFWENLVQCVIAVMVADGVIDPREEKLVRSMAKRHGLPAQKVDVLLAGVQSGEVDLPNISDSKNISYFLRALVKMCLADGNVSSHERRMMHKLVVHFGYSVADIDMMITKERADMYAEARDALKNKRRSVGRS